MRVAYALLHDEDPFNLQRRVELALNAGCELAGGIAIDRNGHRVTFYQALVSRSQEKPNTQ